MISNLLKSVFGSRNDRLLKQYRQTVIAINALEAQIEALTDDELRAKTVAFKQRVQQGETLDALLPEAFAVVCGDGVGVNALPNQCAASKHWHTRWSNRHAICARTQPNWHRYATGDCTDIWLCS